MGHFFARLAGERPLAVQDVTGQLFRLVQMSEREVLDSEIRHEGKQARSERILALPAQGQRLVARCRCCRVLTLQTVQLEQAVACQAQMEPIVQAASERRELVVQGDRALRLARQLRDRCRVLQYDES